MIELTQETLYIAWAVIYLPLLILITIEVIKSNRLKRKSIMLASKLRQKRLREEMESTDETFKKYGLPGVITHDN